MVNPVPSNLRIPMLEHEVVRLRKELAELQVRMRKPTLKEHLQSLLQDYPKINALEQWQIAGTLPMVIFGYCLPRCLSKRSLVGIIFLLRKKLGEKFNNSDPDDVSVVLASNTNGYKLCVTFKG